MSPFTVVRESAVACAPSAMRPFTVLAEVTAALASISMPPLTVSAVPAARPAGTCTEPFTRLEASLDSSQPISAMVTTRKPSSGAHGREQAFEFTISPPDGNFTTPRYPPRNSSRDHVVQRRQRAASNALSHSGSRRAHPDSETLRRRATQS